MLNFVNSFLLFSKNKIFKDFKKNCSYFTGWLRSLNLLTLNDILAFSSIAHFSCSQRHQHFTSSFWDNILLPENYKVKVYVEWSLEKHFRTKKLLIKCWWNWHLWSISSTLYCHIFCTKVLRASFFYEHVTREKLAKRR